MILVRSVGLSFLVVLGLSGGFVVGGEGSVKRSSGKDHGSERRHSMRYNSGLEVETLLMTEREVISYCLVVLEEAEKLDSSGAANRNRTQIKRFLSDTSQLNDALSSAADVIMRHPLRIFKLRRRIAVTWPPVLQEIESSEFIAAYKKTTVGTRLVHLANELKIQSEEWRTIGDVLFLQRFYRIATKDLASGCVRGSCVEPLTLSEVKVIAQMSLDEYEDYSLALDWVGTRMGSSCGEFCKNFSTEWEEDQLTLKTVRANSLLKMENYTEAKEAFEELLASDPSSVALNSILQAIDRRITPNGYRISYTEKRIDDVTRTSSKYDISEEDASACHEPMEQESGCEGTLMCFVLKSTTTNQTVNIEILRKNPPLFMIHEFFDNHQIGAIRSTARNKLLTDFRDQLMRATSNNFDYIHERKHGDRVSLTADDQWMDVIGSRLSNITALLARDCVSRSKIRFHATVRNVGVGWKNISISADETIGIPEFFGGPIGGQFHVFLNEPEAGGSLVFQKLKVKIRPRQGSAVFSIFRSSLPSSQEGDFLSGYVECPLLLGNQWAAVLPLPASAEDVLKSLAHAYPQGLSLLPLQ